MKRVIQPDKPFWDEYGIGAKTRSDLKSDIVLTISLAGRTEKYYAATRELADNFLWKVSQIASQKHWPLVIEESPYDPVTDAAIKRIKDT